MRVTPTHLRERGSVLALVPAGFLVLILLGALAVDSAVSYQRQHQLHDALTAAVNDAVSAGLNNSSFYRGGKVSLDETAVAAVVCRSMAAQDLPALHGLRLALAVTGDSVRLRGQAAVDPVFGRAVPGFGDRRVSSTADATLSGGTATNPPPAADIPAAPLHCA